MNIKKYIIGFAMFALYYVIMRQIEIRVPAVQKLTGAA